MPIINFKQIPTPAGGREMAQLGITSINLNAVMEFPASSTAPPPTAPSWPPRPPLRRRSHELLTPPN
jgi:hypothetical protein